MDLSSGLSLFLLMAALIAVDYCSVRYEIWSIVWCDNRGNKYRQLKMLRVGHTFSERLRMDYLAPYIRTLHKEYRFWMSFKRAFAAAELVLSAVCLICVFLAGAHPFLKYIVIFGAAQAAIVFFAFCLVIQFNRQSKYDRIRMARKRRE